MESLYFSSNVCQFLHFCRWMKLKRLQVSCSGMMISHLNQCLLLGILFVRTSVQNLTMVLTIYYLCYQLNYGTSTKEQKKTTVSEQTITMRVGTESLNMWCSVLTLEFSSAFLQYVRNRKLKVFKLNRYLLVKLQKETKIYKKGQTVIKNCKRTQLKNSYGFPKRNCP